MSSDVLVKGESVSKKFCRTLKRSLWYGLEDLASELWGSRNGHDGLRQEEFWALKDVNFEIKRGECLGVIGPNGAGKSTLLKVLAGLIKPDCGVVKIRGRVGTIFGLGTGFNPLLTGRENIKFNASLLGYSKKEITQKFDAIVDFAELKEFLDAPLQSYSSGMKLRLGFAVAIHLEPDVLLLDEVLAVGDLRFRTRCLNSIVEILNKAAVIFASQSMPNIARICTDVIVLNSGKTIYQGKHIPKGIQCYTSQFGSLRGAIAGSGRAAIQFVEFESNGSKNIQQIDCLDDLYIHLYITVEPKIKHPVVVIEFFNGGLPVTACDSGLNKFKIDNREQPMHVTVKLPALNLNPGIYSLTVTVLDEFKKEVLAKHHGIKDLKIRGDFMGDAPVQLLGEWASEEERLDPVVIA